MKHSPITCTCTCSCTCSDVVVLHTFYVINICMYMLCRKKSTMGKITLGVANHGDPCHYISIARYNLIYSDM